MNQRGAEYADVHSALVTATTRRDQRGDEGRAADWLVSGGVDTDGEALGCAVSFDGRVVVVTIY